EAAEGLVNILAPEIRDGPPNEQIYRLPEEILGAVLTAAASEKEGLTQTEEDRLRHVVNNILSVYLPEYGDDFVRLLFDAFDTLVRHTDPKDCGRWLHDHLDRARYDEVLLDKIRKHLLAAANKKSIRANPRLTAALVPSMVEFVGDEKKLRGFLVNMLGLFRDREVESTADALELIEEVSAVAHSCGAIIRSDSKMQEALADISQTLTDVLIPSTTFSPPQRRDTYGHQWSFSHATRGVSSEQGLEWSLDHRRSRVSPEHLRYLTQLQVLFRDGVDLFAWSSEVLERLRGSNYVSVITSTVSQFAQDEIDHGSLNRAAELLSVITPLVTKWKTMDDPAMTAAIDAWDVLASRVSITGLSAEETDALLDIVVSPCYDIRRDLTISGMSSYTEKLRRSHAEVVLVLAERLAEDEPRLMTARSEKVLGGLMRLVGPAFAIRLLRHVSTKMRTPNQRAQGKIVSRAIDIVEDVVEEAETDVVEVLGELAQLLKSVGDEDYQAKIASLYLEWLNSVLKQKGPQAFLEEMASAMEIDSQQHGKDLLKLFKKAVGKMPYSQAGSLKRYIDLLSKALAGVTRSVVPTTDELRGATADMAVNVLKSLKKCLDDYSKATRGLLSEIPREPLDHLLNDLVKLVAEHGTRKDLREIKGVIKKMSLPPDRRDGWLKFVESYLSRGESAMKQPDRT
ncbi:MAG: hypothetical protein ACTSVT_04505, partial [Candidatus Thorarchaeota archaeon]